MLTINFEHKLRANGKNCQFNFYGFDISAGRIFLIVCHNDDEGTVFRMNENRQERWAVVRGDAPDWIIKIEHQLSAIIEKRLTEVF